MLHPMDRKRLITNAGHFLLLQALWPAAVVGASHGLAWPVFAVLALMPAWTALRRANPGRDLKLAVSGLVVGMIFEVLLIGSGLIHYALQQGPGWPPLWILALWAGFTLNFRHCMAFFQRQRPAAAWLGLVGAPASVIAGVSLGAATAPVGLVPLGIAYGLAWALVMPLLAVLAERLDADRNSQGGAGNDGSARI